MEKHEDENAHKPHKLTVMDVFESQNNDNSILLLTPGRMLVLGLKSGDLVLIKGHVQKQSIAIVVTEPSAEMQDYQVQMNSCLRKNLRVKLGDQVYVIKAPEKIPNAKRIQILQVIDPEQAKKDA